MSYIYRVDLYYTFIIIIFISYIYTDYTEIEHEKKRI